MLPSPQSTVPPGLQPPTDPIMICLFFGDAALTTPELQTSLHAILTAAQQLQPLKLFAATYEDILRRGIPLLDTDNASSVQIKSDSEDELSFEPSPWEPWKVVVCLREKRRYPMLQALDYVRVELFNKECMYLSILIHVLLAFSSAAI